MKNLSKILTLILLLAVLVTLVACNSVSDLVPYAYGVYISDVAVDENGVCTVRLSRGETDYLVGESVINVAVYEEGFWARYTYDVSFDGKAIFSAVEECLAQNGTLLNGQQFSTLKIIYDYDTIYKSMKSNNSATKNGKSYKHSFVVEKEPFVATLTRDVPRQSAWYGVAIAGAVVLLSGGLTLTYARGKYGRKKDEN